MPRATFVSDLDRVPQDLSSYVLKPLFSFAGGGVNVEPTKADIDAVPAAERSNWCLQEKIDYEPALESGELPERRWESYLKLQREARWMAMRHDARLRAEERARWKRVHKEVRASGRIRR